VIGIFDHWVTSMPGSTFEGLELCDGEFFQGERRNLSRTVLRGVRREAHKVWWLEIATPAKFSQQPETEFCAVGGLSIQDGNKHCEA
jgi:hypothetical protein